MIKSEDRAQKWMDHTLSFLTEENIETALLKYLISFVEEGNEYNYNNYKEIYVLIHEEKGVLITSRHSNPRFTFTGYGPTDHIYVDQNNSVYLFYKPLNGEKVADIIKDEHLPFKEKIGSIKSMFEKLIVDYCQELVAREVKGFIPYMLMSKRELKETIDYHLRNWKSSLPALQYHFRSVGEDFYLDHMIIKYKIYTTGDFYKIIDSTLVPLGYTTERFRGLMDQISQQEKHKKKYIQSLKQVMNQGSTDYSETAKEMLHKEISQNKELLLYV